MRALRSRSRYRIDDTVDQRIDLSADEMDNAIRRATLSSRASSYARSCSDECGAALI